MSVEHMLSTLNDHQRKAATLGNQHALVLAGAGTGKTKTIIARAAYLISQGVPANRIRILAFTRKAAEELRSRVISIIGAQAEGLQASTFHTWCMGLIRRRPKGFGVTAISMIDREDQIQVLKDLLGKSAGKKSLLPPPKDLCDIYSYARNTGLSLSKTLRDHYEDYLDAKADIANILKAYEQKKGECNYLDYDDILDVVAQQINTSEKAREWVGNQYDHLLVDEMQDTNPLQWSLLEPLVKHCWLFCVGDDAQSIYGFRGADFENVHSFKDRVTGAVVLKLTDNYRSTQEILDVSNWLMQRSPLAYDKQLHAVRGKGNKPELHTFANEWDEGRWIVSDIRRRYGDGDKWNDHMILCRSTYSARSVEGMLLEAGIPYQFIGGKMLLESAHVRDLLSLLRLVGNMRDEIACTRYLTLFPGVGNKTAAQVKEQAVRCSTVADVVRIIKGKKNIPDLAAIALKKVAATRGNVGEAVRLAAKLLDPVLGANYRKDDWPKRKQDFELVANLAEKHTSILAFIEQYLLDPLHVSQVRHLRNDDVVTVITVHSGKGTECKTCYAINVSPGAYPSVRALKDQHEAEEERRVLYVALTRAEDNLIVTRQSMATRALPGELSRQGTEHYFLNGLPSGLFKMVVHKDPLDDEDFDDEDFAASSPRRGINFD